ncbi:MAG: VanZ family protein [bacterium]
MKKFIWIHGPTILIILLIFFFSSIPKLNVPDINFSLQDKFFHVIEFGIFGFFLQRSYYSLTKKLYNSFIMVFFLGSMYGVLDEFHQSYIPGRLVSYNDMIADALGVLCGQVIFIFLRKK